MSTAGTNAELTSAGRYSKSSSLVPSNTRGTSRILPDHLDHYAYMRFLPSAVWTFLFSNSAARQAILQSLNELDQQIVLRLCYLHQAVSERAMRLWVQSESLGSLRKSIASLLNCHILRTSDTKRSELTQYSLDPTLQKQLRNLVLNGPICSSSNNIIPFSLQEIKNQKVFVPSRQILVEHSRQQWDVLLRFIVSPDDTISNINDQYNNQETFVHSRGKSFAEKLCDDVVIILQRRNLLSGSSSRKVEGSSGMSREAFSWLLKDLRSQIVSLLVEFLFMVDAGNLSTPAFQSETRQKVIKSHSKKFCSHFSTTQKQDNEIEECRDETIPFKQRVEKSTKLIQEVLLVILCLSQATVGQSFMISSLTSMQRRFLKIANDLGLVLIADGDVNIYYTAPYSLLLKVDCQDTQTLTAAMSTISVDTMRRRQDGTGNIANVQNNLGDHWFHPSLNNSLAEFAVGLEKFEKCNTTAQIVDRTEISGSVQQAELYKKYLPGTKLTAAYSALKSFTSGLEAAIVVQSNFKVYVYTASSLHISVLSHLCELQARTSNLVVGLLTRESVLAAYKSGITSDQIVRFLESHAHPALHDDYATTENKHVLPDNVVIQLRIWEAEQRRLTLEPAVLFKTWQSEYLPELFQRCARWAIGKGYCLYYTRWSDDTDNPEFEKWLRNEKYLCVLPDAKSEMVEKIREFRETIIKQRVKNVNK